MGLIKVVLASLNPWIFYISHPATITAGMTVLTTTPVKAMVEPIWVKDNCPWFLTPASWMTR